MSAISTPGSESAAPGRAARFRRREHEERRKLGRQLTTAVAWFAVFFAVAFACSWIEAPRWRDDGMLFLERQDGVDSYGVASFVALEGLDADGDGQADVVVAVEDSAFGGVERVEAWNSEGEVVASWSADTRSASLFGDPEWVASAGDVDNDGVFDLVVSAPRADDAEWRLHRARRPRASWVMVYSGRFLAASSEPLEIR